MRDIRTDRNRVIAYTTLAQTLAVKWVTWHWPRPFRGCFVVYGLGLASPTPPVMKIWKTTQSVDNGRFRVVMDPSMSLEIAPFHRTHEFLSACIITMFLSFLVPILHHFWYITRYWSIVCCFDQNKLPVWTNHMHLYFRVTQLEFRQGNFASTDTGSQHTPLLHSVAQ